MLFLIKDKPDLSPSKILFPLIGIILGIFATFLTPFLSILIFIFLLFFLLSFIWIELGIALFCFGLPLTLSKEIGSFTLSTSEVALALLVLAWIFRSLQKKRIGWKRTPFDYPLLLLFLCMILSLINSQELVITLKSIIRVLEFITVFYLIINNLRSRRMIWLSLILLILSGCLVSLYGIYQICSPSPETAGLHYIQKGVLRATGNFFHPNVFASFLGLLFTLTFGLWLYSSRLAGKIGLALILTVLAITLIFTYSRGAWITFLLVAFIMGLWKRKKYFAIILPFFFLFSYFLSFFSPIIENRLESIVNLKNVTIQQRFYQWRSGFQIFADNPWLGIGYENFRFVYPRYALFGVAYLLRVPSNSTYVEILTGLGLFGFLAFVFFLAQGFLLYRNLMQSTNHSTFRGLVFGLFGSFLWFLIHSFFDYPLWVPHYGMTLFFILGLSVTLQKMLYILPLLEPRPS